MRATLGTAGLNCTGSSGGVAYAIELLQLRAAGVSVIVCPQCTRRPTGTSTVHIGRAGRQRLAQHPAADPVDDGGTVAVHVGHRRASGEEHADDTELKVAGVSGSARR